MFLPNGDVPVEEVLDNAKKADLSRVIVIGITKDDQFAAFASSSLTAAWDCDLTAFRDKLLAGDFDVRLRTTKVDGDFESVG